MHTHSVQDVSPHENISTNRSTTAALVVTVLLLAGLAWMVGASASPPSASASKEQGALSKQDAAVVSPLFAVTQATGDRLAAFLLSGPQSLEGVVATSTRALGSSDGHRYWISFNQSQEACLISLASGPDQVAAMTCSTAPEILDSGIGLQTADSHGSALGYFLPTGYAADAGSFTPVGDQLIVADGSVALEEPVVATQTSPSAPKGSKSTTGDASARSDRTIELPVFEPISLDAE